MLHERRLSPPSPTSLSAPTGSGLGTGRGAGTAAAAMSPPVGGKVATEIAGQARDSSVSHHESNMALAIGRMSVKPKGHSAAFPSAHGQ